MDAIQKICAVSADKLGEFDAFSLRFWKAVVAETLPVTGEPVSSLTRSSSHSGAVWAQPVQGVVKRFPHDFQSVEVANRADDVGRIRALTGRSF